jgi:peroxidase
MDFQSISKLKKAYDHVEDIDLFMGMTHEKPCRKDALIGCTFSCIIGDTFARSRLGDRFFYDLPDQSGSFTLGNNEKYCTASVA